MMLIGMGSVIYNISRIIKDRKTYNCGTEAYGIIADIVDSNLRINRVAQLKAHVLIISDNGSIFEMSEYIGENRVRYRVGDYVRVKYLDDDVNILHRLKRTALSPATVELLEQGYETYQR